MFPLKTTEKGVPSEKRKTHILEQTGVVSGAHCPEYGVAQDEDRDAAGGRSQGGVHGNLAMNKSKSARTLRMNEQEQGINSSSASLKKGGLAPGGWWCSGICPIYPLQEGVGKKGTWAKKVQAKPS